MQFASYPSGLVYRSIADRCCPVQFVPASGLPHAAEQQWAVVRFFLGFVIASLLWASGLWLYLGGYLKNLSPQSIEARVPASDAGVQQKRGRRRKQGGKQARRRNVTGQATSGDDLGLDEPRDLDLGGGGGEARLSDQRVQQGMDQALRGVGRCLALAASDQAVTGRLVFGLRIEPDGRVRRVNLTGPAAVTTGEAGSCLRRIARTASFPSFDGPPMFVRYPITLE